MYIYGGNSGSHLCDVHRLNLDTLEWSGELTCSGTAPYKWYHSASVTNNYMYVFGGGDLVDRCNSTYRLDLINLAWSESLVGSGTPPTGRTGQSQIIYEDHMYIYAGYSTIGNTPTDNVSRQSLVDFSWSGDLWYSGNSPGIRFDHSAIIYNNYMYIFGGNLGPKNDTHRLNISTNSRQALKFDGTDDRLSVTEGLDILRNVSGTSIFAAYKPSSITGARMVFSISSNSSTSVRGCVGLNISDTGYTLGGRRLDADSYQEIVSSTAVNNKILLQTNIIDYANSNAYLYIGGVIKNSTTSFQTDGSTSNTNSATIDIGSIGDGTQLFSGDILELIVYSRVVTSTEQSLVENYLSKKYTV
jgi:hypothetical protein